LHSYHWIGMLLVLIGTALVGLASVIEPQNDDTAPHPLWGAIIIVSATVVTAVQMVIEEKLLNQYNVTPLFAVGCEGLWGFLTLSVLLVPFYFLPGLEGDPRLENSVDAFYQLKNSAVLKVAMLGNIVSIAFFNYLGVTITKNLSATTRMVLDSIRTLVIWATSLAIGWQKFFWVQPIGFLLMVLGTFVYNVVLRVPGLDYRQFAEEQEKPFLVNSTKQPHNHHTPNDQLNDQLNGQSDDNVTVLLNREIEN